METKMKLFFYNDRLLDSSCNGSFAIASRNLNDAAIEFGVFAQMKEADYIIQMDAFQTETKVEGKLCIPYIASEYNFSPTFLIEGLKKHKFCLAISDQARNSLINSGLAPEQVKTVHIGVNPQNFPNFNQRARKSPADPLLYLTNNSSNNRSGYNNSIPAWLDFAKGKNVRLIIKDQNNPKFVSILREIDKEKKIIYIGENFNHQKLIELYNKIHCHLYLNNVTSFGMTPLETSLCGVPNIISNASALIEYGKEEFVTLVDCAETSVNQLKISEWAAWGLVNNLPPLSQYPGQLMAPEPKYGSILAALENSYINLDKLVSKNQKFAQDIRNHWKWTDSVKKIVNILKNQ